MDRTVDTAAASLKQTLAGSDEDSHLAACESIREIVEKVVVRPRGQYKPVEIDIYGQLAVLLRISERRLNPNLGGSWLRG